MVIPTMFWHSQNVHGQGLIHDLRSIGGKGGVVGIMRLVVFDVRLGERLGFWVELAKLCSKGSKCLFFSPTMIS